MHFAFLACNIVIDQERDGSEEPCILLRLCDDYPCSRRLQCDVGTARMVITMDDWKGIFQDAFFVLEKAKEQISQDCHLVRQAN